MTDKILTEAFDKLKAIEESEDPFCVGAKDDAGAEAYTEVVEDDFDADQKSGYPGDNEEPNARAEDRFFEMEDDSGNNYRVSFSADGPNSPDRAFIEVNGITVATYTVGGAGAMNATIKDPEEVLNMLTSAIKAADGTGL